MTHYSQIFTKIFCPIVGQSNIPTLFILVLFFNYKNPIPPLKKIIRGAFNCCIKHVALLFLMWHATQCNCVHVLVFNCGYFENLLIGFIHP